MKYFTYLIITIAAAAVIAGFFIVGSPSEERLRRFDERRAQDMQFLQDQILNYWQSKNKLPFDLDSLKDDIRPINIPTDPQTGGPYEYQIKSELTFLLCATFDKPSKDLGTGSPPAPLKLHGPFSSVEPYYSFNWKHGDGYFCFERTIDPDIYKPPKPD